MLLQGYKEMSQTFCSLRRVRGDNYCALRATLFQALTHSSQLPSWLQEEDVTLVKAGVTCWYHLSTGPYLTMPYHAYASDVLRRVTITKVTNNGSNF